MFFRLQFHQQLQQVGPLPGHRGLPPDFSHLYDCQRGQDERLAPVCFGSERIIAADLVAGEDEPGQPLCQLGYILADAYLYYLLLPVYPNHSKLMHGYIIGRREKTT